MTSPHPKVTSQHLGRKAVVYLRQSSAKQVHENLQSQRLQYALREQAITWGFRDVEIIDDDLGSSAALGARVRDGFTQLLGRVALGEVGMVLSIEVARLSRTDKDWCHLLELCQVFGTLIADADHIYDLTTMDDQLVLGIKGTLSVVELKVLKNRLLRGQEEKARGTVPHRSAGIPVCWRGSHRQRSGSAGSDGNPVGVYEIPRELERPSDPQVVHREPGEFTGKSVWQRKGHHRMGVARTRVDWIDIKEPDLRGRLRVRPEADQDGGERGTNHKTDRPAIACGRMPRFHPRPSRGLYLLGRV